MNPPLEAQEVEFIEVGALPIAEEAHHDRQANGCFSSRHGDYQEGQRLSAHIVLRASKSEGASGCRR